MVDEYQDTNFIQEQLVFLLAGDRKNICVVGDDDQGLYRFRGATIRNILEFPQKFADGECRIIPLVVNYRSNSDIVDFYNRWMATTDGAKFKFSWDNFRYAKQIEPHERTLLHSPAVVKLASDDDPDEWHEKILSFINDLKGSGKLTDYNQIAFLFQSVKHPRVTALARFLEQNHINVYGVAQTPDSFRAAPKVAKLSVTVQVDRTPNDMIMDMGLVNVGADDKGVFFLGKSLGKFYAQPVGFLRGDLSRAEGLANMVGDHIVRSTDPSSSGDILALGQHELGVGHTAVALIAGDKPAVVCLLRICHIVDNIADSTAFGPALADVQRHDSCGCHEFSLPSKKVGSLSCPLHQNMK